MTPTTPPAAKGVTEAMVEQAMREEWDEICSDTGCHPLDITRQGRKLFFSPSHWAAAVAKRLAALSPLPAPEAGEADEEAERAESMEAFHKEVMGWLAKRDLVEPNDDEWRGFTAVIEEHEQEIEACATRMALSTPAAPELAVKAVRDALELARLWLANSMPVVELAGPKPLPAIDAALSSIDHSSTLVGEMDGWRTIETAPKGKKVVAGYRNRLGNWRSIMARYYLPNSLDNHDIDSEDEYAPEGWYEESETHETILPTEHQPTHWRPLPVAPQGGR